MSLNAFFAAEHSSIHTHLQLFCGIPSPPAKPLCSILRGNPNAKYFPGPRNCFRSRMLMKSKKPIFELGQSLFIRPVIPLYNQKSAPKLPQSHRKCKCLPKLCCFMKVGRTDELDSISTPVEDSPQIN